MVRQLRNFLFIILFSIIIAGFYGIVHDQISYTISPEYYTLFKFKQFRIEHLQVPHLRIKVGIIGFLATWWVGLFLGIIYALISLFLDTAKVLKATAKSISINIFLTYILGIAGFIYSVLFLRPENLQWQIPPETQNIQDFINVGSVHNFGYLGGIIGLIFGLFYQIKNAKKIKKFA